LSSGVHSSEWKMEKRLDKQNRYFKEVVDVQVRFDETIE
jgi:hypothetical protein